jgi:hypothetical protein
LTEWGGWNAILSKFRVREEVPYQHRVVWAWAWGEVLRRIECKGGVELNRALMRLLFLPQALLRQPKRGEKSVRGLNRQRFNCLAIERDWGKLVIHWEEDTRVAEEGRRNRERQGEEEEISDDEKDVKKRRYILKLFAKGQVSRGVGRISSLGIADMKDEGVRAQLPAKYPAREGHSLTQYERTAQYPI